MRRTASVVVLFVLLAMYAATWFVRGDSAEHTSTAPGPARWSSAELGFDANGVPTIRKAADDGTPLETACNRQAERAVPMRKILDAATAIPEQSASGQSAHAARENYLRLAREREQAFRACMAATA